MNDHASGSSGGTQSTVVSGIAAASSTVVVWEDQQWVEQMRVPLPGAQRLVMEGVLEGA